MRVLKAWSMNSYSMWLRTSQQHSFLNQRYSASSVMGILSFTVSGVLKVERVIKAIFIKNEQRHWVYCLFAPTDFLISLYSYSDNLLRVYSENSVSILPSASHCSAVNTCHQVELSSWWVCVQSTAMCGNHSAPQVGCSLSHWEGSVCPYKYTNTVIWILPLIWLHSKPPRNLFSNCGSKEEIGSTNDCFLKSVCYTSSRSTALIMYFFCISYSETLMIAKIFLSSFIKILKQGFPFFPSHVVKQPVLIFFCFILFKYKYNIAEFDNYLLFAVTFLYSFTTPHLSKQRHSFCFISSWTFMFLKLLSM